MSKTDPSSVVNYTWDIYGQLSSKSSGENYIFTGKRNLNTVTESNTVKELYTYDALGRRLKVQNADTTTLNFPLGNDTSYEVKKEGTDTTVTKYISANGKYLAKTIKVNTNPEQKYFHHIDLVGSIRAITDATGAVTASYEYEPFGVTIKTTGTDKDNLGFAGKRLDAGSGLSYFGARYYDSEMGRFISRDPAQDGRNWFVYCANNPLGYRDPNGLMVKMKYGYTLESTLEDGFTYSTSRDDVKELDTYKILLKKTLSLLFQDETFMKLWKDIWNDPTVYYITVTKTLGEQYSYDDKTRTIFIYPLGFDGNRNLDPSTKMKLDGLLNHEFGHLYEHYLYTKTGKSVSYESYLKFEQTGNSMYQEICERIIIGKYETNYNIKTGQPLRRWYLNDFNGNPAKLLTGDTTEYFVNWIDLESRGIN